jgi:hypothetical protein
VDGGLLDEGDVVDVDGWQGELVVAGTALELIRSHGMDMGEIGVYAQSVVF